MHTKANLTDFQATIMYNKHKLQLFLLLLKLYDKLELIIGLSIIFDIFKNVIKQKYGNFLLNF